MLNSTLCYLENMKSIGNHTMPLFPHTVYQKKDFSHKPKGQAPDNALGSPGQQESLDQDLVEMLALPDLLS